eukprot:6041424-Karenia_brevis.AAC.1
MCIRDRVRAVRTDLSIRPNRPDRTVRNPTEQIGTVRTVRTDPNWTGRIPCPDGSDRLRHPSEPSGP